MVTIQQFCKTFVIVAAVAIISACDGTSDSGSSLSSGVSSSESSIREPKGHVDAYPTPMRRLTKEEFRNTIRDLLKIDFVPADDFLSAAHGRFTNDIHYGGLPSPAVISLYTLTENLAFQFVDNMLAGVGPDYSCLNSDFSCVGELVEVLAPKAWRRPLAQEEKTRFYDLSMTLSSTEDLRTQYAAIVHTLLFSPNFLYRPEIDEDLNSAQAKPLSAYELASRLSYFLWASMPDDILLEKAKDGSLLTDDELAAQVIRMLDDKRASTLVSIFAEEWFYISLSIKGGAPARLVDFNWTEELANNFVQETYHFLEYLIKENRPVSDLVNAEYTFLNKTMAEHYGVFGFTGDTFEKHEWPSGSLRRGLLGQSSILAGNASWVIHRGGWISRSLLCNESPEMPLFSFEVYDAPEELNPKAQMEHILKARPSCMDCHADTSQMSYSLEIFDSVGRMRDKYDNGDVIETHGTLTSGETFKDAYELGGVLAKKPELALCVSEHIAGYALGRLLDLSSHRYSGSDKEPRDYPAVYDIYLNSKQAGHGFRDIIKAVVLSPVFRERRGADSEHEGAVQ